MGCPALRAQRTAIAEMLLGATADKLMNRDNVPDLRVKAKWIREILNTMDEMVRAEVIDHGPIPLGNGKELRAQHAYLATPKARSWIAVGKASAQIRGLKINGVKTEAKP